MDVFIRFLSETLGIPYTAVEGSVATMAFLLCAFLLKLLWDASKRDNKQVDLEQMLAQLAIRSLDSYDANTKTIEKNTETIQEVVKVLGEMGISFASYVGEMKFVVEGLKLLTIKTEEATPVLEQIKDNLIKTSKTTVIVKDSSGNILTTLTAEPDEDNNLVVQFSPVVDDNERSG